MGDIKRLIVGQPLEGIPTDSWNRFREATLAVERGAGPLGESGGGTGVLPIVPADVINHTSAARSTYQIVGLEGIEFEPTGTDPPSEQLVFKAVAPKADKRFGVLLGRMEPTTSDGAKVALLGAVWVRVDIKNASDETCGPIDDDYAKLESSKGSVPILWKETGTGVKWSVVLLGGGASAVKAKGMLIASVGAATLNGTAKEITPGMAAAAVVVMKWNDAGTKLVEDTDLGTIKGVNNGPTGVRGSTAYPVGVSGEIETVDGEKRFVMSPAPIDVRILPDWAIGTAPTGNDDPDLLILHSKGGSELTELASDECAGA